MMRKDQPTAVLTSIRQKIGIKEHVSTENRQPHYTSIRIRSDLKDKLMKLLYKKKMQGYKGYLSDFLEAIIDFDKAEHL